MRKFAHDGEPRSTGEIEATLSHINGVRGERSSHPVLRWAHAVVSASETTPLLRTTVVAMYHDLPEALREGHWGPAWRMHKYAELHNWDSIEPSLTEFAKEAQRLPENAGFAVREMVGMAGVVHSNALLQPNTLDPLGIIVSPIEYQARCDFGEDFKDTADWLEALGNVVWMNGMQTEAEAKDHAVLNGATHLSGLHNPIRIEDIERVYEAIVKTIRPNAQVIPVFRDGEDDLEYFRGSFNSREIRKLTLGNNTAGLKKKATENYLRRFFNGWLYDANIYGANSQPAEDVAWLFATYIGIHPHYDYNGTMARILVNTYAARKGLSSIDWKKRKGFTETGGTFKDILRAYLYNGRREPFIEWFKAELGE